MQKVPISPEWLFEGTHLKIGVLTESRVVVLERSAEPAGDADLGVVFGPAERAIERIPRERYGLLIDVRAARGRNDTEFEKRFEPYRARVDEETPDRLSTGSGA